MVAFGSQAGRLQPERTPPRRRTEPRARIEPFPPHPNQHPRERRSDPSWRRRGCPAPARVAIAFVSMRACPYARSARRRCVGQHASLCPVRSVFLLALLLPRSVAGAGMDRSAMQQDGKGPPCHASKLWTDRGKRRHPQH
jgi:hypothetical protein